MTERPRRARWRNEPSLIIAAVAIVGLSWILGNPRSAGPDEPAHMVASAGLVRGDREGQPNPDPNLPGSHLFDVPGMVGAPDPGCWAFKPEIPVACASTQPLSTATRAMPSTSFNYPPWAFVLPGLASFVPSAGGYAYLARAFSAAIPLALVCGVLIALTRRRTVGAGTAVPVAALLGLTPIAWFTFGVVNPSALAIAGGLALWTGLLTARTRLTVLLTVAGWSAVLLARRDGPVWATAIVLTCCVLMSARPSEFLSGLGRWVRWTVIAVAALPILTPAINRDTDSNLLLAFTPVALVIVEFLARRWTTLETQSARRALVGYCAVAATLIAIGMVLSRPGGFEAETLRLVVSNTGEHLRQLVGDLGWLDTSVPTIAVYTFWAVVGGLLAIAAVEFRRGAVVYGAGLAGAIVIAWLLELGQGADYGRYWQGRYTMPFAVGLPLVLTWRTHAADWLVDRLTPLVAASTWIISNLAFLAAQQRWGVGVNGSWYPWDWDTWGAFVPPVALVLLHAGATAVLVLCCAAPRSELSAV